MAVIGAGIVGVTAAYQLAKAGLRVSLIEGRRVGRQVTGRSTAKITTQHSLIYRYLIRSFGLNRATAYAEANRQAAFLIRTLIHDLSISCDLEQKDAFAYTCDQRLVPGIAAEVDAARSVGFIAEFVRRAPLPFKTFGALRFPDQAQFNPLKYLNGLARAARREGARIFENTRVTGLVRGKKWTVKCPDARFHADHVVLATHLPIAGPRPFDQMTRPRCHIAMAFRMKRADAIEGIFIGVDKPTHSLRMGRDRHGPLLVALGPKFMTGHDGNVGARFFELESWVRRNLPVGDACWRWVNEDYDTPDRLPLVGSPSKRPHGLYVATGFNGWGITNGTAGGVLIADQILGRPNTFSDLFNPSRKLSASFNAGGETQSEVKSLAAIRAGEGAIITRGKKQIAVWRSESRRLHAFSAACTHKGCPVTWNNADRTWDCPCHGSMYSATGDVIHGPAVEPLQRLPVPFDER